MAVQPTTLTLVANSALVMILSTVVLVLGYTFLPVGKRKIANQLPGAVFAVLACGVLSFGFRIYVDNYSSYSSLYGSI
ncbi:MAG: YihY/virulence factor BrkB family protein, partial [Atopobiaceae bacterium]|nr:YihY/virulence factor BrkB family protein [Atopobiaceae bacterium]